LLERLELEVRPGILTSEEWEPNIGEGTQAELHEGVPIEVRRWKAGWKSSSSPYAAGRSVEFKMD
jgi:hypothetical protein